MPAESKPAAHSEEASLREIEALVKATPPEPLPTAPANEDAPDIETVARDLGISVDEVRAMMEEGLG